MTKTSKSERKWGKKDASGEQLVKDKKKTINKDKQDKEMFKVLIDGSGFTEAMDYEDCQKLIAEYERDAARLNQIKPSLVLVKQ